MLKWLIFTFSQFILIACGISNALDGTEDDAIYDDEMPEVADDDMEDEFETDSEEDDDD